MGRFQGQNFWSVWLDKFMLPLSLSAKYPEIRDQLQKEKKNIKNLTVLYERLKLGEEAGGRYLGTFCTISETLLRVQKLFKS